jgi:hypothetical protein
MSDSNASNPFDPRFSGFAGFGSMMEQMDAFKRLWSSMDGSSRLVPTLDVEELDKRITDLKAVEQWLNLNLSMLRGSIQALEIQRGTLEAVKAFGTAFQSAPGWPGSAFGSGAAFGSGSPFEPTPKPASPSTTAAASTPSGKSAPSKSAAPSQSAAPPQSAAPGIDPSAWWTLLQNNFQQIAQAALSGTAATGGASSTGSTSGGKAKAGTARASSTAKASGSKTRSSTRKPASGR